MKFDRKSAGDTIRDEHLARPDSLFLDDPTPRVAGPPETIVPTWAGDHGALLPWIDNDLAGAKDERADTRLYDKASRTENAETMAANFDRVAKHRMHVADAPKDVELPDAAQKGLQKEWEASRADGHKKEHGGNLVRNKDGSYAWRTTVGPAKADTFIPDEDNVGKDQKLVGFGHTHGYASGAENVSFSDDDIADLVDESQPLNLLQSGKSQFMIARTAEFEAMLKDLDDEGAAKLRANIARTWQAAFKGKEPMPERAERATEATCRAFKLAYYRGQGGKLARVP